MYVVSNAFRNKEYSGESEFKARLVIGENTIPNDQIAQIEIDNPIFDSTSENNNGVFYVGTFISQKITIKFKNLDGLNLHSGDNVKLYISQYVNDEWVEIPIGLYLIDDLAENYYETCEISCLDYAVKFKNSIDYSPCFVDGKATVDTILQYICTTCGVTLGTYPTINGNVETGQYDSTVSAKQWISYIAELKGANAKIGRDGTLNLIPLNQTSTITIDALQSESWKLGEKYEISRVLFDNGLTAYQKGNEANNTLFIRQDNPFILSQEAIDNIYESLLTSGEEETEEGTSIDLDLVDDVNVGTFTLYGNTSQETTSGKNLLKPHVSSGGTSHGITYSYDEATQTYTFNGTCDTDNTTIRIGDSSSPLEVTTNTVASVHWVGGSVTNFCRLQIANDDWSKAIRVDIPNISSTNPIISSKSTTSFTASVYQNFRFNNGSVANNLKVKVMVANSDDTTYEPYTNGASPNPNYPQEIEVVTGRNEIDIVGKNLLGNTPRPQAQGVTTTYDEIDGSLVLNGTATSTWCDLNNATNIDMPIGTYTLSTKEAKNYNIRFRGTYEDNTSANFTIGKGGLKTTFTTTKKIINQRIFIYEDNTLSGTIFENEKLYLQLEKGNQATDFKKYEKQSHEINLGKNLFDKDNANVINAYINGSAKITSGSGDKVIYISCKPNTTYTIQKMLPRTTSKNRFRVGTSETIPIINTTLNQYYNGGDGSNVTKYTITTSSNANYLVFFCYTTDTETTFDEIEASIQIEKGNQATSYSSYFTPIELCKKGNYQDNIYYQKDSKNLFDKDNANIINASINTDRAIATSSNAKSLYISCLPNTTYTISKLGKRFRIGTTTDIPVVGATCIDYVADDTATSLTITTSLNANYLLVYYFLNNTDTLTEQQILDSIQIEGGNQATEYQPYGSGWFIKKNIGKVVLTGNDITAINTNQTNTTRAKTNQGFINALIEGQGYSNYFSLVSNWSNDKVGIYFSTTNGDIWFRAEKSLIGTTLDSVKAWVNSNNIILYYILNTPTYVKVEGELEGQLETTKDIVLYKGIYHINQNNNYLPFNLQLDYASSTQFEMYSLETKNYGDISLDAWDYLTYTLGEDTYKTYNNAKLTYEMTIMSDTKVQISSKQQEETTNYIGGSPTTQVRKLKTTVNALDNKITLEAEQIDTSLTAQEGRISSLEINTNSISSSVSSLQTLSQEQYEQLSDDLDNYKTLTDDELGEINSKFDDYATKTDLVTIENSVNTITTDTYTKTEINSFLVDGSVKKLQTTSMTADENGLTFAKTNAKTTSNINESGLSIMDENGNPILRAIYDDDIKNTIVETYRHQVQEYFIMGSHSRFEDYEDGTGVFYIS